eukprot:75614_1
MAQQLHENANDWKIDWNIDTKDDDYKETKKRYIEECSALFHKEQQTSIFKVLTAGKRIQKPLLLYLVDSYTRARINSWKQDKKPPPLSIQEWVENDPQVQTLTGNNKQTIDLLKSALDLFYKRFNSPINFGGIEKINDTIRPFALYVNEAMDFIKRLFKNATIPPFQLDLWIIPNGIEKADESEPEPDDIDESDDEKDNTLIEIESDNYNIDESLKEIAHVKYERQGNEKAGRTFMETYTTFIKQKGINSDDAKDFPRNKRIIMIADRRNKKNNVFGNSASQDGDKIYMYQPPKGHQIPNNHLYEKFIQTSAECVLPKSKRDGVICKQVNSKTGSSKYFMLSFHVEAEDEIRCYMYHRSQIWRFFPQDILDVWPCLFAECDGFNKQFVREQKFSDQNNDGDNDDNTKLQFVKDLVIPDVKFENSPFQN